MHQQPKCSASKFKFSWASNRCKSVIEAAKLVLVNETKESILYQKLGSCDFWGIANSVLNRCKICIPPCFNSPELLSSASDKAKFFAEFFSNNSDFDDSGISLPAFLFRCTLKLDNILVILKLVKKAITDLDASKTSSFHFIPVVALKKCDPELLCILAELFKIYFKKSCLPDCWKVTSVLPIFKNVVERSASKI